MERARERERAEQWSRQSHWRLSQGQSGPADDEARAEKSLHLRKLLLPAASKKGSAQQQFHDRESHVDDGKFENDKLKKIILRFCDTLTSMILYCIESAGILIFVENLTTHPDDPRIVTANAWSICGGQS